MIAIAAEHFQLTPAIRTQVEGKLSKLRDLLPEDASIHVYLSEPARKAFHKTFSILCKVRIFGKDIIVREEDENLYTAIETARTHLARKIVDEKQQWVRIRRKDPHLERLPNTTRLAQPSISREFLREDSNILETSGGEMPDPSTHSGDKTEDIQVAFSMRGMKKEERDPESHGDIADCAEEEIEDDIQNKLDRIHLKVERSSSETR